MYVHADGRRPGAKSPADPTGSMTRTCHGQGTICCRRDALGVLAGPAPRLRPSLCGRRPVEGIGGPFVDGAYATVKGLVRTYVLHQQLVRHLPPPPVSVLDVGGGAGHQSLPLARLGLRRHDPGSVGGDVGQGRGTDGSGARRRPIARSAGPGDRRVSRRGHWRTAVPGRALPRRTDVSARTGSPARRPVPMCRTRRSGLRDGAQLRDDGGAAGARASMGRRTGRVRRHQRGRRTRHPDPRRHCRAPLGPVAPQGVQPQAWYGVWLFSDWMDLPVEDTDVEALAQVELEASLRDPYRQLSRVFHLVAAASG